MKRDIGVLFSLNGKVAIITGGARGIGRAVAEGFLRAGAIVYSVDIIKKNPKIIKEEAKNSKARFIMADVTDFRLMQKLISRIYNKEKRIDILVNNAGVSLPESSEIYSDAKWEKNHIINLKAPFKLSQIVARYMKRQNSGIIINITSICSELGFSNNPAYAAFKGGLKQLTKALAKDWARYNIRVNNLGLGYFKTEMTRKSWKNKRLRGERTNRIMLRRWGEPEDLVGPAVFLASEASRYITGQDLYVDGGWLSSGI